uniref:Uncharacterized protein n=1 Tax=Nelumbo nucifera TaxID=4432 RepID=A0A822ZUR9_NELNU|nr:TPA_asm: hypothetical protein HUJ06_003868 [Nelumbo nucifera]
MGTDLTTMHPSVPQIREKGEKTGGKFENDASLLQICSLAGNKMVQI